MGLLSKSLKKTGQERVTKPKPAEKPDEKPSVGWLGRSFSERTKALADKLDLESQYARLEALTQSAAVPPPPKPSLRERAKRFLSGLSTPVSGSAPEFPAPERAKMSLRQRAAQLMKKITGSGSGSGEAGPSSDSTASTSASRPGPGVDAQAPADELPEYNFFPWHALSEEGSLQPHVAFGEEPHPEHLTVAVEKTPEPPKSTLSEFAETMERITENLKNLHVQLDSGNFIRDIQVERPAVRPAEAAPPLISHHVPVGGEATAGQPVASGQTGIQPGVMGATTSTMPPPSAPPAPAQEKAKDIFWPKDLPLDLPARDIRLNADGTVSVVPGPFQLPYLAEDIAPPESDISHFTRNLKNAELFIAEGELQLTRIIYERLLSKVMDDDAQRKIQANLDALDNYRKSHDWGNFMPVPPWNRNPWQDYKPPQLNISEMPVEAKNITINMDKGFFEIAKAIFELKKTIEDKKSGGGDEAEEGGHPGEIEEEEGAGAAAGEEGDRRSGEDRRKGGVDMRGDGAPERRKGAGRRTDDEAGSGAGDEAGAADEAGAGDGASEEEKRAGEDRRKGGIDTRGEGAEDRRSGRDRRDEEAPPANAPPPPLAADGQSAEPEAEPAADGVMEQPKIPDMSPDGQATAPGGGDEDGGSGEDKEEENKVQEIRGVLELKTPDQEDTPFLTLTYDFTKIPHAYRLAKDNGIFEYAYYKYKPMLVKAHQFIKRKQITRALNYYRVIREQQIPTEFRHMVDRNIKDITEYLQKYLVTRAN